MKPFTFKYQTVTSYRTLPPKWRIIEPKGPPTTGREYLAQLDAGLEARSKDAHRPAAGEDADAADIVDQVFANQMRQKGAASYALASMITERQVAARRHRSDIKWRLEQLMKHRPLVRVIDGQINDVEKQIFDLEKQLRLVDVTEWRDLLDLRKAIAEQRQEYHATRARMDFLAGGYAGQA